MKLSYTDIIDSKKGQPAVVAGSGPSLDEYKKNISEHTNLVRFFVNEWYDFFKDECFCVPDYHILANPSYTIQTVNDIDSEHNVTILYADSVDTTDVSWINDNVKTDWFGYDQRHWDSKKCDVLINEFNNYVRETNSYSGFKKYGNNEIMWDNNRYPHSGLSPHGECCVSHIFRDGKVKTLQEKLQEVSNFNQHYSTGDTVILHAIAFAILAGCNPIYVVGMDLDYSLGYAGGGEHLTLGDNGWNGVLKKNLINDLYILNESAKLRNIEIINLKQNAWYGQFNEGDTIK